MDKFLVTFNSTREAFKAEKVLKATSLNFEFVPTPRKISSECGFSFLVEEIQDFVNCLTQKNINYSKIFIKSTLKGEISYELYTRL